MSREAHVPFYEGLGVQFPRPTQRFCLSFRDAEDLLAQRGITVTYETIRHWCQTFGPDYARRLRYRQGREALQVQTLFIEPWQPMGERLRGIVQRQVAG